MSPTGSTRFQRLRGRHRVMSVMPMPRDAREPEAEFETSVSVEDEVVVAPLVEPEVMFECSHCHRDMPMIERSRINLGRCRACV